MPARGWTVPEDRAFADDLAAFWEHRTDRQKRDLAIRWLARAVAELLADLCESEGMLGDARNCRELKPGPRIALDFVGIALLERVDALERNALSERAGAIVTLMQGVARVALDVAEEPRDPPLHALVRRVRQLARASGRLEEESRRLEMDLVDA